MASYGYKFDFSKMSKKLLFLKVLTYQNLFFAKKNKPVLLTCIPFIMIGTAICLYCHNHLKRDKNKIY